MSWLVFIAHGFNPFLLMLGLSNLHNEQGDKPIYNFGTAFSLVFASLIMYVFWLGIHYLVLKLKGSDASMLSFIGVDKGFSYFLPFVLGALLLVNELLFRQLLQSETAAAVINVFSTLLVISGIYFMFINYLAWMAE